MKLLFLLTIFFCSYGQSLGKEDILPEKSSSFSTLQHLTDRFDRKTVARRILQEADRYYPDLAHLSDSLLLIAIKYYKNQENSPDLSRLYYYLGICYETENRSPEALKAYLQSVNTLSAESDVFFKQDLDKRLHILQNQFGKQEVEDLQWKYRYLTAQTQVDSLSRQLKIWKTSSILLLLALCIIFFLSRYRASCRKRELFESQLFIERLQRAEDELKEKLVQKLDEKDNKLKDFFQHRVEMIKEFVALSKKYSNNVEKLKDNFKRMVSTDSFSPTDWNLLKEGVNIMGYGILDYLKTTFPDLTEENLRYCALICAGFETDELAILWDINNDSIYKRRTRLRQKLGLEKNQDLKRFFENQIERLHQNRSEK